jgi:hypothetical protein
MVAQSLAHLDGDNKYGFENWNDKPVEALTYIGAALRHLELYKYGERLTRDTKVPNLGAVMACCAILLDAELNGNLIDNTKHSKATCDMLHDAEATVARLNEMQKEREANKAEHELKAANPAYIVEQGLKAATFELLKPTPLEEKLYSETPIETCSGCNTEYDCKRVGVCFNPPKFTTCGKCDDIQECGGAGRCFGR